MLDLGSDLFWVEGVAATGKSVTSIDLRPHWHENFAFKFLTGDAANLPLPDNSYDLVTAWQLLHHVGTGQFGQPVSLDHAGKVISETARVLNPGGHALMVIPVKQGKSFLAYGFDWIFGIEQVREWFSDAGLEADFRFVSGETFKPVSRLVKDVADKYDTRAFIGDFALVKARL